ncbi:MAG: hypothetical protein NT163_10705 [Chlorobiales bacterium]|nr:hypothetical protein [Chlorobiales bacterium]
MKTGLPLMVGIAWAPIIWMVFMASLGPVLFKITGSWLITQGGIVLLVLLATYFLLKVFHRIGDKFYSKDE